MNQSVTFQAEVEASIENFLFMIDNGEHVERALQRIGLHAQAMTQRLKRNGHEIPYVLWQMNAAIAPKRSKKVILEGERYGT